MLLENTSGSGAAGIFGERPGGAAASDSPIPIIMTSILAVRFIAIPLPQASPHFLMTRTEYRLFAALALSLTLHLLPFVQNFDFEQKMPPTVAFTVAELRQQPAAAATPPLSLPELPKPTASH